MAKEKSTTELKDEKSTLLTRGKEIVETAKTEKRKLNEGENTELGDIQIRLAEIGLEISALEMANKGQGSPHVQGQAFSLRKAMLQMVDGVPMSEDIEHVVSRGREQLEKAGIQTRGSKGIYIPVESRASFTATGAVGTGSDLINTEFMDILTPLRDRLVLAQAGANVLTGLIGNIDIPAYSGATANWENENAKAQDGGGNFSHKTMKPKRLTSVLTVSRQLLVQDSLGVEQLLRSDLINAVRSKLEATILGNHAHAENKPDGLFTGFSSAAVNLDWGSVVDLETAVDLGNALDSNLGYIAHTALRGKMKKTIKDVSGAGGFVLDRDGRLNDYQCLRTNAIASNAAAGETPANYGIVFGNWADLMIGQWGALDLMVDPYTRADEAFIRIIVNSYWDCVTRRDVSFAKALMK